MMKIIVISFNLYHESKKVKTAVCVMLSIEFFLKYHKLTDLAITSSLVFLQLNLLWSLINSVGYATQTFT